MFTKCGKYGARKITCTDGKFDSGLEFKRWIYLKQLQSNGEITNLKRQVPYVLIPLQKGKDGKVLFREMKYVADFVYTDCKGEEHIEDTKGFVTDVFKIKRKLFYFVYGKVIEVVKKW